jgi:hypothetical protein
MELAPATKADYDEIVASLHLFWGDRDLLAMHHPLFIYEFGDCALVMRDDRGVTAYLFGLVRVETKLAYVHLAAVRNDRRGHGLGRVLCERFAELAVTADATRSRRSRRPLPLARSRSIAPSV